MVSNKPAGVILAGGRSSRMGVERKALVEIGGQTLLAHVIGRLRPQLDSLDWRVVLLSLACAVLLLRLHWGISRVLAFAARDGRDCLCISAVTGAGVPELVRYLFNRLESSE